MFPSYVRGASSRFPGNTWAIPIPVSPDRGLGDPPTPHCLRPAVGTPCHFFLSVFHPTPRSKMAGVPPTPPLGSESHTPTQGTLGGTPPPFLRALIYVGAPAGWISPDRVLPPTPHCLRPTVGTPCHHFCAWDPPSPQVKKGRGPPDPSPDPDRVPPTQGTLGGTYPPLSRLCFTSETVFWSWSQTAIGQGCPPDARHRRPHPHLP